MRSWQPATATKTRWRHSKAVWWATPQSSAAASTGTFHVMGSTKRIQVAKSFLQFSKMVPDRAPKRARQSGHLNLRCPAGVLPSLAARPDARSGGRPRRQGRLCGLVEGPVSDAVAAGPCLGGLPRQREVGVCYGVDPRGAGVAVDVHSVVPSTQAPTRPGRRQT